MQSDSKTWAVLCIGFIKNPSWLMRAQVEQILDWFFCSFSPLMQASSICHEYLLPSHFKQLMLKTKLFSHFITASNPHFLYRSNLPNITQISPAIVEKDSIYSYNTQECTQYAAVQNPTSFWFKIFKIKSSELVSWEDFDYDLLTYMCHRAH